MNQQQGYGSGHNSDGNSGGSSGIDTVTVADPNENAFTIQMPRGWNNQAFLMRTPDSYRSLVVAQSPDGNTTLFIGDPHLPQFVEPTPDLYPGSFMAQYLPPHIRLQSFVPAEPFFVNDLRQRYGQVPGFRIIEVAPSPALEQKVRAETQKQGINAPVTTVRISFEYLQNGSPRHGILNGVTYSLGIVWVASVSGVMTTEDPVRWNAFLLKMESSQQTNPQWLQQQQNLHHQTMASMEQQNRNIQAQTHLNTMNHQTRMNAIHQTGAASTQRWHEQQAQNDASHQSFMNTMRERNAPTSDNLNSHERFLNVIKEENTVVDQSGTSYQVDGHHERYFVNTRDNTYIGTDSNTELNDLRTRMGIDPDGYEEAKIKK